VASFDSTAFDTNAFSVDAWLFDGVTPEPTPSPGGGLDLEYRAPGLDQERIAREDEEILAVIAAFMRMMQ